MLFYNFLWPYFLLFYILLNFLHLGFVSILNKIFVFYLQFPSVLYSIFLFLVCYGISFSCLLLHKLPFPLLLSSFAILHQHLELEVSHLTIQSIYPGTIYVYCLVVADRFYILLLFHVFVLLCGAFSIERWLKFLRLLNSGLYKDQPHDTLMYLSPVVSIYDLLLYNQWVIWSL